MNVVMIGTGAIAHIHAEAIKKLDSEIIGAYDISVSSREHFSTKFGGKAINNEGELQVLLEKADYCVLSTPPSVRVEYTRLIMKAGCVLLIEKPVATNMEDALQIKELVEEYKGRAVVAFSHLYRPSIQMLYSSVKSGELGEPINIFSHRIGTGYGFRGRNLSESWRTDPELICGMTIESLSHDISIMLALSGHSIESVTANVMSTLKHLPDFDTNSCISMRLHNGGVACINASWSSDINYNIRGYIGTKGTAYVSGSGLFDFEKYVIKTDEMQYSKEINVNDILSVNPVATKLKEHENIQECIKTGSDFFTPLKDGIDVLEICLASLLASKQSKVINISK